MRVSASSLRQIPTVECGFQPLPQKMSGVLQWHPALERLSRHFGAVEEFRRSLEQRLYPGTWSGSIVSCLEAYLTLLQTWFSHPVPQMSFWARDTYRSLEREIAREYSQK